MLLLIHILRTVNHWNVFRSLIICKMCKKKKKTTLKTKNKAVLHNSSNRVFWDLTLYDYYLFYAAVAEILNQN